MLECRVVIVRRPSTKMESVHAARHVTETPSQIWQPMSDPLDVEMLHLALEADEAEQTAWGRAGEIDAWSCLELPRDGSFSSISPRILCAFVHN